MDEHPAPPRLPDDRPARLLIGAMSGTSADGVDAALVRVSGRGLGVSVELLRHAHRPYPADLRRAIFAAKLGGAVALAELARLGTAITLAYAECVNDLLAAAGVRAGAVAAVAAHGQTLYHAPPETIQWLDPALLAARVGCPVVSDFRRADCAAGGQGAPLVPLADWLMFRSPGRGRVVLNVGGIANLTYLPAGGGIESVRAFDTGPGVCLSDWVCRGREPAGPGFDAGGERAMRGRAMMAVASRVADGAFARREPPKSTDTGEMVDAFRAALDDCGATGAATDDLLATACLTSAVCVAKAMALWVKERDLEVLVGGGGALNRRMMDDLAGALAWWAADVRAVDAPLIPAREAVAFAVLGAMRLDGEPGNLPACTGAGRAVVLGSVTAV